MTDFNPVPKVAEKTKSKKKDPSKKVAEKPKQPPKHPERDEFDLEELAFSLSEAFEEKKYKMFAVYNQDEPLSGKVTKMDSNTKLIHIQDKYFNVHKVHFLDILSVSNME
ncbi:YolD-like family protein [Lysinibacillus sp. NPDC047702]|uniref:YolD-like family protein n=1 Tax=unclassified Lysinibacillus TaxID=2636778 RepID=UPI003D0035C9